MKTYTYTIDSVRSYTYVGTLSECIVVARYRARFAGAHALTIDETHTCARVHIERY